MLIWTTWLYLGICFVIIQKIGISQDLDPGHEADFIPV